MKLILVIGLAVGGGAIIVAVMNANNGPDRSTPQGATQLLYEAIADWDTAEVADLTCPEAREDVQAGLFLGSAVFGLSSYIGLGTPHGKLRGMSYAVTQQSASSATVMVNGRLLYGEPFGSVKLDGTRVDLRKEGAAWCIASGGAPAGLGF